MIYLVRIIIYFPPKVKGCYRKKREADQWVTALACVFLRGFSILNRQTVNNVNYADRLLRK